MQWYYAQDGQSVGPVPDAVFRKLVETGTITRQTLVWREGMPSWSAWGQMSPSGSASFAKPALKLREDEAVCAQCGRLFAASELVEQGELRVCAACAASSAAPSRGEGGAMDYGGFWIRFLAKLIDGVILGVVQVAISVVFVLYIIGSVAKQGPAGAIAGYVGLQVASLLLNAIYAIVFVGRFGATPGKMALRLKIVRPDGSRVSYGRALGRWLAEMLSAILLLIGYLIAAFDDEKRALHDRICDTRVIRS